MSDMDDTLSRSAMAYKFGNGLVQLSPLLIFPTCDVLKGGRGGRGFKLNVTLTLFSKNYNYFGDAPLVKYIEQCSYKNMRTLHA